MTVLAYIFFGSRGLLSEDEANLWQLNSAELNLK